MNVNDLYWSLVSSTYRDHSFVFNCDNSLLFGFLPCDRDYIHATLPSNVVRDIVGNNAKYVKCMYYDSNRIMELKNTLSMFVRMNRYNGQLFMSRMKLKDDLYYVGPGIILDDKNNILFSVCIGNHENKLIVSPKVFNEKTTMNKYIVSKIIPEFTSHNMEIIIRPKEFLFLKSGLRDNMYQSIDNIVNDYRFCEVESPSR